MNNKIKKTKQALGLRPSFQSFLESQERGHSPYLQGDAVPEVVTKIDPGGDNWPIKNKYMIRNLEILEVPF